MVLMDVTLNVILGNVSCGANVTSLMCIDEPTSPWDQFTINPTSPPAGPTSPWADANVTLGQSHAQSNVTPDPTNVTLGQIHDHSSAPRPDQRHPHAWRNGFVVLSVANLAEM